MKDWQSYNMNKGFGKGKGIKIAHVDSGINKWHPHIHAVSGGISLTVSDEGRIILSEDYNDTLGHGTAVAGVLSEQVPEAELWGVKVFDDNMYTHIEVLCAAIEWCIEMKMDIINLSLSVKKDIKEFEMVCKEAERSGIVIVSSCDKKRGLVWPGIYSSVYGVESSEHARRDICLFNPEEDISFRAFGLPRHLEGPMQKYNLQGHSFAAAYVSSYIAKLMEKYQLATKAEVDQKLLEKIKLEKC